MYIFRNCNRLPFSLFFFFQLTWATAHTARAVSISNIPILSVNRFQRIGSFFQYPSFLVCGISQHLRSTAVYIGLTQGHSGEESACSAEDPGLIPGLGRSPGKGNGNLLQQSSLRISWTEKPGRLKSFSQVVLVVKNLPANTEDLRHGFNSWVRKIPWRRAWQPTPVVLAREFHRQRNWAGYSLWVHKELDMTSNSALTQQLCK